MHGAAHIACVPILLAIGAGNGETASRELDYRILADQPAEYPALRAHVLALPPAEAEDILGRATESDDWRGPIIATAWRAWRESPEACAALWNYKPPGNRYRNPFPRMQAAAYERFGEAGDVGVAVAAELMLIKGETHVGALPLLLAERRPAGVAELLIDVMPRGRPFDVESALVSLGPDVAPKAHVAFKSADLSVAPSFVRVLTALQYAPALPDFGERLLALQKQPQSDPRREGRYTVVQRDLGLSIAKAFEVLGDASLEEADYDAEQATRRVDSAKAWWRDVGSHRDWSQPATKDARREQD